MDKQNVKPVFDFETDESSTLIHKAQAEIYIDDHTYTGDGEIRLDLFPSAKILAYGYFKNISDRDALSPFSDPDKISSFSINGRKIEGFCLKPESNMNSKKSNKLNLQWCPKSQPIEGIGDESTEMSYLVFHLFNFVNFYFNGVRYTREENRRIPYIALSCIEYSSHDTKRHSTTKRIIK